MKLIKSGITAAKGFTTGAIHCGIRNNKSKKELAYDRFASALPNGSRIYQKQS